MHQGRGGIGSTKHGKSGHATQSPRARFLKKMEAERDERKDRSSLKEPLDSIKELFGKKSHARKIAANRG